MSNTLKLRRGTTTQHSSFTGAEGEVTVDTTKKTLVVHDGSTAGGFPVIAQDSSGNVGIGTSTAWGKLTVYDSSFNNITLTNASGNNTQKGGLITGAPYANANSPFVGFAVYDDGSTAKSTYIGGGSWGLPDANTFSVFTAPSYTQTVNTGLVRFSIALNGQINACIPGATTNTVYPGFMARAWVQFNGTGTVAIVGSGNVTSITDSGVGQYQVNLTTAMPDQNFSLALSKAQSQVIVGNPVSTSGIYVATYNASAVDDNGIYVQVFR